MQLRAFAKINLDLRILGRRPDGYHEVRTVMQTIAWADEIQIDRAERFEFIAHGAPGGEDNLVVRAVRAFERVTGETVRARVQLFKRIPVGAGLGGGSADAAVTVMGLMRLYDRDLPHEDLLALLSGLGSDVPFFASGGRALGTGRGNEIEMLDDEPECGVVVIHPGIEISTAEAYSWLTMVDKSPSIMGFRALSVSGSARNDFESVVFARHPALANVKAGLLEAGARRAALSGSGSAVFGIFGSDEEAVRSLPRLTSLGTVKAARPLSRTEYLRSIWGVAKW